MLSLRACHSTFWPLVGALAVSTAHADCPPDPIRWTDGFNLPGFNGGSSVWTADIIDDDGAAGPNPPRLYVGGNFTDVGGRIARGIARWNPDLPDGQNLGGRGGWEPFPVSLFSGTPGTIKKFISFDLDGAAGPNPPRLLALGQFIVPGISNLAYFNGVAWRALPVSGSITFVEDAIEFDPDGDGPGDGQLFVATSNGVYRWDGTSLVLTIGGGTAALSGDLLAIFDTDVDAPSPPSLFVASSNLLSRWDGSRFVPFSPNPGSSPNVVLTADPDGPGPLPRSLIAINSSAQVRALQPGASSWTTLPSIFVAGSGISATTAIVFDPDGPGPLPEGLTVSGTPSAGTSALARHFNGTAWSNIGTANVIYQHVRAMAAFDFDGPDGPRGEELFCAGLALTNLDPIWVANAALWDPNAASPTWKPSIPGDSLTPSTTLRAAAIDPDGDGPAPRQAYISGSIGNAGPLRGRQIVRLDHPLSTPDTPASWTFVNPDTTSLNAPIDIAAFDFDGPGPEGESLVSMRFWVLGLPNLSTPIRYVGRVVSPGSPGAQWEFFGQFTFTSTSPSGAMTVFDDDGDGPNPAALYVSGAFTMVDGVTVSGLARLAAGSTTWQAPPVPYPHQTITLMGVFDDDGAAGPHPPRLHIVAKVNDDSYAVYRMDDDAWTPLGSPLGTSALLTMTGFDADGESSPLPPRLYVGGDIIGPSSPIVSRVHVWDGAAWSPAGGNLGNINPGSPVRTLMVFDDDGPGPGGSALFASGGFQSIGTTLIPGGLAKLANNVWTPVPTVSGTSGGAIVIDADDAGPRPAALVYLGATVPASGVLSTGVGVWCVPPILADHNADWTVTVQDIFDFLADYFNNSPRADADGSGQIGVGDIFAYLRAYFSACD